MIKLLLDFAKIKIEEQNRDLQTFLYNGYGRTGYCFHHVWDKLVGSGVRQAHHSLIVGLEDMTLLAEQQSQSNKNFKNCEIIAAKVSLKIQNELC